MNPDRLRLARDTTAAAVAEYLDRPLDGPDGAVERFSPFPAADQNVICFLNGTMDTVAPRRAFGLVLAPEEARAALRAAGYSVIVCQHPKYDLARVLRQLCTSPIAPGIHPTAIVDGVADIARTATIGPYAVLSGTVRIGDASVVGAHARLYHDVTVGSHCRIRSGVAIGGDPFNFGVGPDQRTERLPGFGGVRIGDDVDIGHGVVISRGIDRDTVIGHGVRINDLTMIGNAVSIDDRAMVMANCMVGGHAQLGRGCWLGMGAHILESVSIGEGAKVGMGSVVLEAVPPGAVVVGVPARFLRMNR